MLADDGGGLLPPASVARMLRDRTTATDRAENPWFFGDHLGWGLMMSVPAAGAAPERAAGLPRGYGWEGGSGTAWRTDPAAGLTGILLTQRMMTSPEPTEVARDFWSAAYAGTGRIIGFLYLNLIVVLAGRLEGLPDLGDRQGPG